MTYQSEPGKQVPVVLDVDVAVAGGGISGVFAALAAARNGATTVLIDRLGAPGGNIGPGMDGVNIGPGGISGGTSAGTTYYHMPKGPTGIPREFLERLSAEEPRAVDGPDGKYPRRHPLRDSHAASSVLLMMLEESGANLLLSTYASDPILDGTRVTGLFVENKSGRQAVRSKVVIDATGEADLARRAGAPVLYPKASYHEIDGHAPAGLGLFYALSGVRWEKYDAYMKDPQEPTPDDLHWAEEVKKTFGDAPQVHVLHFARTAWEKGEYHFVHEIPGVGRVSVGWPPFPVPTSKGEDLAWGCIGTPGVVDSSDGLVISKLEARMHRYVFESARFWRRYVPGFENSYLLCVSPYLGARGGACIEGEYIVTMDDIREGRRYSDVLYLFMPSGVKFPTKVTDFPYRCMLPKKLDGIIAVGRSASSIPDTLLRGAHMVPHNGQAGGTAAALAVREGVAPKELDVKLLQRALLSQGFYLGDNDRLKELGLIGRESPPA